MGRSSPLHRSLLVLVALLAGGCAAEMSGGGAPPRGRDDSPDPRTEDPGPTPPSAPSDPDSPDAPPAVVDPVEIAVESPAPGAFVPGTELRITGRVTGPAREIRVGDQTVALDADGRFSTALAVEPGAHRVRLSAGEGEGADSTYVAAIVGTFATPGDRVTEAATLSLGPRALSVIADGAADILSRQDFDGIATASNPVMDAWWGEARIAYVALGDIDAELRPESGSLRVIANLHDLDVGIEIDPSIGPTLGGSLGASVVRLEAPVHVGMAGGEPDVSLGAISVTFEGFSFMLDYVPSFIENSDLVRDAVESRVVSAIETAANDALPPYLAQALSRLPMSGQIDAAGAPISYDGRLSGLSVTPSGLSASVDLAIAALSPVLSRGSQGALRMTRGAPPSNATSDVGVAVAVDALNAAALALWASGKLDMEVGRVPFGEGELTVGAVSLLVPSLARGVETSAPMSLAVHAALPPVARTRPDGTLELFLADVPVDLAAETAAGSTHLFSVSIAARVAVTPRVVDGAMTVELGTIELDLDGIDVSPDVAEVLASLVRDIVLPQLTRTLVIPSFRIPTVYGFTVNAEQLAARDGYVGLGGSLSYASP